MDLSIRKKAAIRTKRLTLKPYAQEDIPALAKLLQNKEITKTFMVPDFETKAQVAVLVQKLISFSSLADTRHLEYGIYLNDALIGFVNDCGIEEDSIEIGYVIHPDYQRRGYATEAVQAILHELKKMGFRKVTAGFFAENTASRQVMLHCGMHPIEYTDKEEYRGQIHTCCYCEISL